MIYPRISIVTPTFNRADYLEETILSVLNQNYPNLEYIIIDGGSTDHTIDIIKKYESSLAYWISEPDQGMYYAIQKGFEKSTGEILAWLNSDDKYHEGCLNVVANIFSELETVDWITGTPSLFNEDGLCVKIFPCARWSESRFWVGDYRWIQQESIFWRRSLWEKAGSTLDLTNKFAADFELWCRFFKYSKLNSVETVLSGFRFHGNQISEFKKKAYEDEVIAIFKSSKYSGVKHIRFMLIKCLWSTKNLFIRLNLKVTSFLASVCGILVDKLHSFPGVIYYDFEGKKWRI
jgi:glycosyltransferase involved in cell wall biosynthesis